MRDVAPSIRLGRAACWQRLRFAPPDRRRSRPASRRSWRRGRGGAVCVRRGAVRRRRRTQRFLPLREPTTATCSSRWRCSTPSLTSHGLQRRHRDARHSAGPLAGARPRVGYRSSSARSSSIPAAPAARRGRSRNRPRRGSCWAARTSRGRPGCTGRGRSWCRTTGSALALDDHPAKAARARPVRARTKNTSAASRYLGRNAPRSAKMPMAICSPPYMARTSVRATALDRS